MQRLNSLLLSTSEAYATSQSETTLSPLAEVLSAARHLVLSVYSGDLESSGLASRTVLLRSNL